MKDIIQEVLSKIKVLLFLSCLLAWWLLGASVTCLASAPEEPQTATVEMTELTKSQEALKKARQELMQLQLQIATLKALSVNQENSLQKVNESFKQYAEEKKKERIKIKAQRNAWAVAALVACIGIAVK